MISTTAVTARVRAIEAQIAAAGESRPHSSATVRIVAVTKRHPDAAIEAAVAAGLADVSENFVQELVGKQQRVEIAVRWHFVGRLQTNKVKHVAGRVALIHAVDSERLARAIDRHAGPHAAVQDVLLAVNVAGEASKGGVAPEAVGPLRALIAAELPSVRCVGLMTMPPLVADPEENRVHFRALRRLRDRHIPGGELSMGTTRDFLVAVQEGATLVRLGTSLFGPRP